MSHIRPIHSAEKRNFQTLVSAIEAGHACLMSVFDTSTGQTAVLICVVNHKVDHPEPYEFVPLAMRSLLTVRYTDRNQSTSTANAKNVMKLSLSFVAHMRMVCS